MKIVSTKPKAMFSWMKVDPRGAAQIRVSNNDPWQETFDAMKAVAVKVLGAPLFGDHQHLTWRSVNVREEKEFTHEVSIAVCEPGEISVHVKRSTTFPKIKRDGVSWSSSNTSAGSSKVFLNDEKKLGAALSMAKKCLDAGAE